MLATLPPAHRGARARDRKGFTLIELMVVIVILGLLIGLVVPNVWHALTSSSNDACRTQMSNLGAAISMYMLEKRSLPQSLDDLTQPSENSRRPFIESIPLDPWKQPYEYKVTDPRMNKYEISSAGEDKIMGTDDDLFYPERAATK